MTPLPPGNKLQPSTSPMFVGCEEHLQRLQEYFHVRPAEERKRRAFVLYGIGGVGKTQICLKFLEEYPERYAITNYSQEVIKFTTLLDSGKYFGLMQPTMRPLKEVFKQLLMTLSHNLLELDSLQRHLFNGSPPSNMSGYLCLTMLIMSLPW
jgi:DNA transposition AAA+ family ATPase